jgi:hypothetical protein
MKAMAVEQAKKDRGNDLAPAGHMAGLFSLGRVLINRTAKMLTWMRRPMSVIGGKADMARTCQYVRL